MTCATSLPKLYGERTDGEKSISAAVRPEGTAWNMFGSTRAVSTSPAVPNCRRPSIHVSLVRNVDGVLRLPRGRSATGQLTSGRHPSGGRSGKHRYDRSPWFQGRKVASSRLDAVRTPRARVRAVLRFEVAGVWEQGLPPPADRPGLGRQRAYSSRDRHERRQRGSEDVLGVPSRHDEGRGHGILPPGYIRRQLALALRRRPQGVPEAAGGDYEDAPDQSLLAWGFGCKNSALWGVSTALAQSPAYFAGCSNVLAWGAARPGDSFFMTKRGLYESPGCSESRRW